MYIGFAIGLFIVSYLIQLWLCLKAKNKHIKLIPLYLCVLGAIYSALLYMEFFGLYRTGSWMQLEAYIYFIILLIIGLALLLAKITHIIAKAIQRRNYKWRNILKKSLYCHYNFLCFTYSRFLQDQQM